MKTAAGLENVFVSPKEYEQTIRAEERATTEREIVEWLSKYVPVMIPGNTVYGPYADACDIIREAISRGEYRKK